MIHWLAALLVGSAMAQPAHDITPSCETGPNGDTHFLLPPGCIRVADSERRYSLPEIDHMRSIIAASETVGLRQVISWNGKCSYVPDGDVTIGYGTPCQEIDARVESRLRDYMAAGADPESLESITAGKNNFATGSEAGKGIPSYVAPNTVLSKPEQKP